MAGMNLEVLLALLCLRLSSLIESKNCIRTKEWGKYCICTEENATYWSTAHLCVKKFGSSFVFRISFFQMISVFAYFYIYMV